MDVLGAIHDSMNVISTGIIVILVGFVLVRLT